jgi:hypothetical protein
MASGRYLVILESAEHGGLLPMKSQPLATACTVRHKYGSAQKGPRAWRKGMAVPRCTTATSTTTPADAVRVAVGAEVTDAAPAVSRIPVVADPFSDRLGPPDFTGNHRPSWTARRSTSR